MPSHHRAAHEHLAGTAALALLGAAALLAPLPAVGQTTPPVTRAPLIAALNRIAATDEATRREAVAAIRTPAEVAARQQHVRQTILGLLGDLSTDHPPLAARITHTIHQDGFDVETVIYDSEPGQHITADLFVPTGSAGKRHPAVIISPGHGSNGKASDYAFAADFARNGIVALAWDIVGEGERREYFDPVIGAPSGRPATIASRHSSRSSPACRSSAASCAMRCAGSISSPAGRRSIRTGSARSAARAAAR